MENVMTFVKGQHIHLPVIKWTKQLPPTCIICDHTMRYDYTGPFGDAYFICASCKVHYCDYDGMYARIR